MDITEYERILPNVKYDMANGSTITFLTPNRQCVWRVETLDTKEPDTIAWLHQMQPGEVLFDVGANMGQYSLIAAKRGLTVHAFEPESQNFALLCRNIGINGLGETVTAWPLALSNEHSIDYFYVQSLQVGGSCSSYGQEVDYHLNEKKYAVRQGCMAVCMDTFAHKYGKPDHVKIDVDGLEHLVVAGMGILLNTVKSVLVELNTALDEHQAIIDRMESHGLYPDTKTADEARRKDGAFKGIGNVIFYRKSK